MDRIIHYSFLNFDNFYNYYPALSSITINDYQLITVIWNIFLALLPLVFYLYLRAYWHKTSLVKIKQKILAVVLFIIWLLLFPNTAYIITDIRHLLNYCPIDSLNEVCSDGVWMIPIFFTYSIFGWVSFYYILKLMSDLINKIFKSLRTYLPAVLIIPLTSLGVLLGLLNRFNSWDIFLYPAWLLKVSLVYFSDINYFLNWLVFTAFLYLLYFVGDHIFREINLKKMDKKFKIKRTNKKYKRSK